MNWGRLNIAIVFAGMAVMALVAAPRLGTAQQALMQGPPGLGEAPINDRAVWWDDRWWNEGHIAPAANHKVRAENISFDGANTEIGAWLFRPDDDKSYPAVLFQHGRRGLDDLVRGHALRLAARGFVVLAPDIYASHMMDNMPLAHDEALEDDVNAALSHLLQLPGLSSKQACLYSHTRGGYYTLKVAVTKKRQNNGVACYVSFYPHWQDPNAPEPEQVYRYALEADDLNIPALIFIGEHEQYQRRRSIETAVKFMKENGKDVVLMVYAGVGRGFDFRPAKSRTLADDLAAKDSIQRAATFMRKHLAQ